MAKKRGWKTAAVREYLKKHPDADYKKFTADTKIKVVDAVFYTVRTQLRNEAADGNGLIPPGFIVQGKLRGRYEKLAKYLKANPGAQYKQMTEDTGTDICSTTFNRFKKRCLEYWGNGGGSQKVTRAPRKKSSLYHPIFTVDSTDVPDKAKDLLKQFVEALNESKVGRYEVREYRDPRELEVREVQ